MKIDKSVIYRSLLVGFMAVIFLCAIGAFGGFAVKSTVSAQNEREVTLTINGLSIENEVESRIYGNSYAPITATAIATSARQRELRSGRTYPIGSSQYSREHDGYRY